MKNFLTRLFGTGDDVSSKRVITFIALICMIVGFIANLFFEYKVERWMFESMQWIVMTGLGVVVAEKFSPRK